jgi:hypothetical protein
VDPRIRTAARRKCRLRSSTIVPTCLKVLSASLPTKLAQYPASGRALLSTSPLPAQSFATAMILGAKCLFIRHLDAD